VSVLGGGTTRWDGRGWCPRREDPCAQKNDRESSQAKHREDRIRWQRFIENEHAYRHIKSAADDVDKWGGKRDSDLPQGRTER
jgi:hypothetical protein